jgi:hypothetical protein
VFYYWVAAPVYCAKRELDRKHIRPVSFVSSAVKQQTSLIKAAFFFLQRQYAHISNQQVNIIYDEQKRQTSPIICFKIS